MDKLTIGADPEIVLVNPLTNRYVSAQSVLRPTNDEFGLDGNPTTLELRPHHTTEPLALCDNIFNLLNEARKQHPQVFRLQLKSSDKNVIAGGHLHFGHSNLKLSKWSNPAKYSLDSLLSTLLAFVEIPENRSARLNSDYGHLGDMRSADWGIEYRTPPSWLASRKLAEAVTSLGYSIVDKVLQDPSWKSQIESKIPANELKYIYDKNIISALKMFVPYIVRDIKSLPLAGKYWEHINYLIRSARAGRPLLATEIKKGWQIKFIDIASMKLADLPSLVKKLAEAITVPGDNSQQRTRVNWNDSILYQLQYNTAYQDSTLPNLLTAGNDFRVETIASNVSVAINAIVDKDLLKFVKLILIKIRGLKQDKGNQINLYLPLPPSRIEPLKKLLTSLCQHLDYPEPNYVSHCQNDNEVYLPRQMRELNTYLPEAICLVVWLFLNREVYKSQTKTKNGRLIGLPFGVYNTIKPLAQRLKNKTRSPIPQASDFLDDGGEILSDKFIAYARSELLPRVRSQCEHAQRLRLPRPTRNLIHELMKTYDRCECDRPPRCPLDPRLCNSHLLVGLSEYSFNE